MKTKISGIELRRIAMPLVAPFRTSFGVETSRDVLLVRVVTSDGEGWAECAAMSEPRYCSEYVDGAQDVLRKFLIPALPKDGVDANAVGRILEPFTGHHMAKSALETAVLDAQLRRPANPSAPTSAPRATASPAACPSASWTRSLNSSTPWRATSPRATSGSS
jgi:O-succinylbenzoate synthase